MSPGAGSGLVLDLCDGFVALLSGTLCHIGTLSDAGSGMRGFVDEDVGHTLHLVLTQLIGHLLTDEHRGHIQLRKVVAVPGLSCRFQWVGGTRENRIWWPVLPIGNCQIRIPVAYSIYMVSLIFSLRTQELRICLPTGHAHSWLLEIAALERCIPNKW